MKLEHMMPPPPVGGERKKIVIAGAGIIGLYTAFFLSEQGHEVTVLEGQVPAAGSTGRSSGCSRMQFSTEANILAAMYSTLFHENFRDLMEISGNPVIKQRGYLYVLRTDRALEKAMAALKLQHSLGLTEAEFLDVDAVAKRFPYVATDGVKGYTFCPRDGSLDPEAICRALVERLQRRGVEIHCNAPIIGAEISGDPNEGGVAKSVRTHQGEFKADYFVLATGAWTPHLLVHVFGKKADEIPFWAKRRYNYYVRLKEKGRVSPEELQERPMVVDESGAYSHPEYSSDAGLNAPSHNMIIGWASEPELVEVVADLDCQDKIEEGYDHRHAGANYGRRMWAETAKAVPSLDSESGNFWGINGTGTGFYTETQDSNPVVDRDKYLVNLVLATAMNGHGCMLSGATGYAATWIINNEGRARTLKYPDHICRKPIDMSVYHGDRDFTQGGESSTI